jgi:hypothetical protein
VSGVDSDRAVSDPRLRDRSPGCFGDIVEHRLV